MNHMLANRRELLGLATGIGAIGLAPGAALARRAARRRDDLFDVPRVRSMIESYVGDGKVPGAVGVVGRGTDEALFMASGKIATGNSTPMDADSLFRIYSMTKPITGMAAMMLIEDGKIGLDQNIADFIPGFAKPMVLVDPMKDLTARPATAPITIRNLLTHTAGLGYTIVTKGPLLQAYFDNGITPASASRQRLPGFPEGKTAPSLEVFANRLATLPLIADPGTKWSYSIGLDLMGRIIEIASGMAFDAFLQKRLFDPLGMTSTYFTVPQGDLHRMTTNYGVTPNGKVVIDDGATTIFSDKPAFPFGGAGLVTSPRDYDRFLNMLAGRGALGRTRVMKEATAMLGMSNLLPPGIDTSHSFVDGQGFGAGGRVTIKSSMFGPGVGTFGWGGAAATIAFVDPVKRVRAAGYAQFMPDQAIPFTKDFSVSVYRSLV